MSQNTLEESQKDKERPVSGGIHEFALKLFSRSVLKQAKLEQVSRFLGSSEGFRCLDLGSDNGVISYYLRKEGGDWASGDLTDEVVSSIRSLVQTDVSKVSGSRMPYQDREFDKVVVVDMLEHVEDEARFVSELARITKPGGIVVVNTPNLKKYSLLRGFRHLIGQTDEAHGHLRAGYGESRLQELFSEHFEYKKGDTYSRFFSESIDTAIVFSYGLLKRFKQKKESSRLNTDGEPEVSKGLVVTERGLRTFQKQFRIYSYIYPLVWVVSRFDRLIPFLSGYMRIARFKKR